MAVRAQFAEETAAHRRLRSPAAGSGMLHLAVVGIILISAFVHGRHDSWGSSEREGAIQATLVSRAPALPLPQDQPPTPNVLATETPSPAPAPEAPQPKAKAAPEPDAIPIAIKQTPPKTKAPTAKQAAPPQPTPKQQPNARSAAHPQPIQRQENRAQYGQAAPQIARSMSDREGPPSPVTTPGGDFGSRFPWYVDVIKRKVAQNGHQQEVDPRTPSDARVYIIFNVSRDGVPSDAEVEKTSRSPSLDTACIRAVQRVDTFGSLPAGYGLNSLRVEYYCDNSVFGR
jgi:protein TonB